MAFSKSLSKAQIPVAACQLCGAQVPIKCKCLDCELYMCVNCPTNIHLKVKGADKHRIVNIEDIGQDIEGDTKYYSLNSIPCILHPNKTNCIFCRRCDELSCPTCLSTLHKQHDFIDIEVEYETKIASMKKERSQIQIRNQEFSTRELVLVYMRKTEKAKYDKSMEELSSHEEVMRKELDKCIQSIKKKLDNDWKSNERGLDNELNDIQNTRKILDKKRDRIDELSNPLNSSECFDKTEGVTQLLRERLPTVRSSRYQVQRFIPGHINQSYVGKLQAGEAKYPFDFQFQLLHIFETKLSNTNCIVSVNNNLWVINGINSLQRVSLSTHPIKTLPVDNAKAWGIVAGSYSYTLLVATRESTLKQMDVNSMEVTDSRYSVAPWLITSVHATRDGKVIIGATDRKTTINAIIFMDENGQQIAMFESSRTTSVTRTATDCSTRLDQVSEKEPKSEAKQCCFSEPTAITSTIDTKIFLIDSNQDSVTILNEEKYVDTYTGNHVEHKFTPTDLTATPSGRAVLVVEPQNDMIHILDTMGKLVTVYKTTFIGITRPRCLHFASQGRNSKLYIGCGTEGADICYLSYSEQ